MTDTDRLYVVALKEIIKKIGNDVTYEDELHSLAKSLLGKEFSGVFPVDKLKFPRHSKYAIVNLDTSDMSGSHWIGVVKEGKNLLVYDSFGRPAIKIVPLLKGRGNLLDTELDAEQDESENNCGQRSLTSLFIHKYFGRRHFMNL